MAAHTPRERRRMAKTRCDIACKAYQAISDEIGLVPYNEKMQIIREVIEVLAAMHDKDMATDVKTMLTGAED